MKSVELTVVNFGMDTNNKGGFYRTDEKSPVAESDIRVVEGPLVTLTSGEVYSGKRVVRELPDGVNANALKIVGYIRETNTYEFAPSWITEQIKEKGRD